MKIAILYISIGKYEIFWENFYKSAEKYLLAEKSLKHYFVFTDCPKIFNEDDHNIHKIYQQNLGWPNNTLMRFHVFDSISEELKHFDYIYFFNANMLFIEEVNDEIIPKSEKLIVFKHPGYFNKARDKYPYETNPKSEAFISDNKGEYYFMGGLNGGNSTEYLKLIKTLKFNIDLDLQNKITAKWHDESHINRYVLEKKPKILGPEFVNIENYLSHQKPKIIILDKNNFGGHLFLRGIKLKKRNLLFKMVKVLIKRIIKDI